MGRQRVVLALAALAAIGCALPARAHAASSRNVREVARVPALAGAISIDFIRDTMFVSTFHGLYSFDVSDARNPLLLDALPLPNWENEDMDVDAARKRVYIARDPRGFTTPATPSGTFPYGAIHIIDVSDPRDMRELNTFLLPAGHTTTCVNRCDFLWTAGPLANPLSNPGMAGRPVYATDVRDPMHPKPCPQPIDTGRNDGVTDYAHDVQVDREGIAWVSGQGGVRGYWTSGRHRNPVTGAVETAGGCRPVPYAGSGTPKEATPSRFMHNAWRDWRPRRGRRHHHGIRRNDVLLATEENVTTDCASAGRFVTYDLRGTYRGQGWRDIARTHHRMSVLGTWTPEHRSGSTGCASSHYFASRGDGITVNAFYTQGVRFLDTSDPRHIRQVGWFVNADSDAWEPYWHSGYVYVADFQRGVEILKFRGRAGGARPVRAPALAGTQPLRFDRRVFGGLCPVHPPSAR